MSNAWNAPEREITPESALSSRRSALKWIGLGFVAVGSGAALWWWRHRGTDAEVLATGGSDGKIAAYYPAPRNDRYPIDRQQTKEADTARWCNFYEFTYDKDVWRHVDRFKPSPWTLEVGGL